MKKKLVIKRYIGKLLRLTLQSKKYTKRFEKETCKEYRIVYFVGEKGLEYLNASIYSIKKNFDTVPAFEIITDGTPIEYIQKGLKHKDIVVHFDTWRTCAEYYRNKGNKHLYNYAVKELWGKKFVSILYCMEHFPVVYNDTDVLWYNQPKIGISKGQFYMSTDDVESFSHPMLKYMGCESLFNEPMNAGFIMGYGDFSGSTDYEKMCTYLDEHADNRTEQTGFAILTHYHGKRISKEKIYMNVSEDGFIIKDKAIYKTIWARHYVNLKFWTFWRDFYCLILP